MTDREKVIKGLECHKRAMYGEIDEHGIACNSCPYKDMESSCHSRTEGRLITDALALLQAQEPRVRCKDCKHFPVDEGDKTCIGGFGLAFPDDRCPCKCEDGFYSWMPEDDWYCANGERRDEDAAD